MNNKWLLATDNSGKTCWHVASKTGNLGALEEAWDCAKD
jgi:hypothetical protein